MIGNSELLPDLDLALLESYVRPDEQFDAVLGFRERLRTSGEGKSGAG